jgi:dTDP-4-amino-4,6-dideoxygalactose transaminase
MENKYGFNKCLLTTSCTDALELAALLLDIKEGDEVILPSYTFVSTANAFALRGAKLVFADSNSLNPNIDANAIASLITPNTKVIVVVHYAGIACDMKTIMKIANKHNIFVVEDAAQAIDAYYFKKPLGAIGHLAAFSFHETKNIQSGEGGMLVINDDSFSKKAEIIREKGTNRSAFFRGEVDKYGWVSVGSSFLASDITAAFLYAQFLHIDEIQKTRVKIWDKYNRAFKVLSDKMLVTLPQLIEGATNNGHMYYLICKNVKQRDELIAFLKSNQVSAVFHYQSLHKSSYFAKQYKGQHLINADFYSDTLVRLPLFKSMQPFEQQYIIDLVLKFFTS